MHELGIISGVLDAVGKSVAANHADKVFAVNLSVGEETEVIKDCMDFAWEALTPGTVCEGATLNVHMIKPKSVCLACGNEFEHDRFHNDCPKCGSFETQLIAGHELNIDSIDVDLPDDDANQGNAPSDSSPASSNVQSAQTASSVNESDSYADAAMPNMSNGANAASAGDAYTSAMDSYADQLEREYKQAQQETVAKQSAKQRAVADKRTKQNKQSDSQS